MAEIKIGNNKLEVRDGGYWGQGQCHCADVYLDDTMVGYLINEASPSIVADLDDDELDPEIGMFFMPNWHLTEILGASVSGCGLQSLVDQIAKILEEDPAAFARVLQHRAEVQEKQAKKKAEQEARGW